MWLQQSWRPGAARQDHLAGVIVALRRSDTSTLPVLNNQLFDFFVEAQYCPVALCPFGQYLTKLARILMRIERIIGCPSDIRRQYGASLKRSFSVEIHHRQT